MSDIRERVYFVSLGCPKNQVDTEVMLGIVRDEGRVLTNSPEDADTLVVNTCGFIDAAKEESIQTILELAEVKRRAGAKQVRLIVTGCLSQRYPDELAAELPEVDHFLGSADAPSLRQILQGNGQRLGVTPLDRRSWLYDHESPRQTIGRRHVAYVKIAEGCDRPCAFCIIPKLRGPQRSRTIASVVKEVESLTEAGTREICLVAQDLTTYGTDLETGLGTDLVGLLDALVRVPSLHWVRLHYAYPTTVTDALIDRIAGEPKVATYIDVPLQHVDSDVLKRMRRGYGEKQVRGLVERLRARNSHIWLRTTMLVGHPGETDAAFSRLEEFVAEGLIDHLGVFPWSREEGTVAALQPGRVEPAVAETRAAQLMSRQAELRARAHENLLGVVLPVMIDGGSDESEFLLEGRHEGQAPGIDGKVIVCDGTASPGSIVPVRITQVAAHDLVGSLVLDDLARA